MRFPTGFLFQSSLRLYSNKSLIIRAYCQQSFINISCNISGVKMTPINHRGEEEVVEEEMIWLSPLCLCVHAGVC